MPLLHVQDLRLALPGPAGPLLALRGLDFTLEAGQTLGLIGESGCGKSLTALALMGLLPEGARLQGAIHFEGQELVSLPEPAWCRLRSRRLAMVFQEPMTALNPLHPIGRQVAEPLRLHLGLSAAAARAQALRLLDRVQLPQAAQRLDAYPHQLSGGQRQRVVIAIALACRPALLVADEPTTALDATLQREVLQLVAQLVREDGMALLLISHDIALMAEHVQQLAVMYAGAFVEQGPAAQVLAQPAHPYTRGLLAARPRLGQGRSGGAARPLPTIPGRVPPLPAVGAVPAGCSFAERCGQADARCHAHHPPALPVGEGRLSACWQAQAAVGDAAPGNPGGPP